jgi:hypothetical protein
MMSFQSRFFGILFFVVSTTFYATAQDGVQQDRWRMNPEGSISWLIDGRVPHDDHIEMSGEQLSVILRYGVKADSSFDLSRTVVWPMLRSFPNKTRANLVRTFNVNVLETVYINEKKVTEKVRELTLDGLMTVKSTLIGGVELTRTFFPSPTVPAYLETYEFKNTGKNTLSIEIPAYENIYQTDSAKGIYGKYTFGVRYQGSGHFKLDPGKSLSFNAYFYAHKKGGELSSVDSEKEKLARQARVKGWRENLVAETPDKLLNEMFAFAKIRASESIYRTKGGLMHSPGGGAYYAAIWANDQAEYIGPFFPFLGYAEGNEASLNAYLHFARFMNPEYKPIPSSIISEGENTWHGAKDRGDGAMIAYGAARFALASGDRKVAEQLWPLIEWCLEFCRRKVNTKGVVASDSDELENRFPAGDANLCTSSLYYDALLSATYLGKELGKPKASLDEYSRQAQRLRSAIETHFGSAVEGFNTYRYYEGNNVLRAWICMPLTVGIYDRKDETMKALFSPRLWTVDGLATQAGDKTFWDRSTLYALRGVFASGETEKALPYLQYYSNRRLLGEHVPYPVEAYPEGGQRHLSAESGLYCRIFTEGIFGIRPTGLRSFQITPQLPAQWNEMKLKKVRAFGSVFDVAISRMKDKIRVVVTTPSKQVYSKVIAEGKTIEIAL